ncbi:response regulator transcription factor [Haploplasma modicum]|uniref:response regulator transcription factor n=1 Tax=Haploplasma modicum TaxID=2150 RepID=UPI000479D986|nr:response regulator [Haploplasma modicum]
MYKLSVVDDEHIVLERLKQMIAKINDEDLVLESSFDNGDDAYNQLSINPPDILVTDIHIPFINGIELSKMLKKINPLIKIIIITGYEELSYAKEAIDLEVVGFISKPISFDELSKIITKAKNKIELEKSVENNIDEFNQFYHDNIAVIRENYLSKLLNKNVVNDNFKYQLDRININLDYSNFVVGYFDYDQIYKDEDKEMFEKLISNQLYISGFNYHLFHKEYDLVVLLKKSESFIKENLIDTMKLIIAKAKLQLSMEISIGLSSFSNNKPNYKQLYLESKNAITSRKLFGGMQVFLYSDLEKDNKNSYLIDDNIYKKLTYMVRYEQDNTKAKNVLVEIKRIITYTEYLNVYEFNLSNILNSILKGLSEEANLNKDEISYSHLYKTLLSFKTVDEAFNWFNELVSKIQNINYSYIENKTSHNMNLILEYINNNYTDSNLNLETLADMVGFSISYITTLFKTNYKTTFVKYLTNIRMEKAKELLLNTPNKIIEIASLVGYNDPYYFSHSFKKHLGLSPKEYRDEHENS